MARTSKFPRVLWLATAAWLAGCGRLGFDLLGDDSGALPDAPPNDGSNASAPQMAITAPPMTTECGNAPATYRLKVANPGDAPLTITRLNIVERVIVSSSVVQVAALTDFQLRVMPTPWTIAPGDTLSIDVLPPAAVIGTNRGGDVVTGAITLESNAGAAPARVDFSATVVGANLVVTSPGNGDVLFAGASGGCPSPQDVSIENQGNADADILGLASSGFNFTGFVGGMVTKGQAVTTTVEPSAQQQCRAPATIQYFQSLVSGPVCEPAVLHVTFDNGGASSCACS